MPAAAASPGVCAAAAAAAKAAAAPALPSAERSTFSPGRKAGSPAASKQRQTIREFGFRV